MRTLLPSVVFVLAALPIGCSEDDRDGATDDAGHNSGASAGTGSRGGSGGGSGGKADTLNEGGAPADEDDATAAARLPLCERICTTQGQTSCPPPDHDACVQGWCTDTLDFFPQCVDVFDTMLACMVNEPTSSYFCDQDGMSFPKEEACAGEQATLLACFMANAE